jgi:hypothetical protein
MATQDQSIAGTSASRLEDSDADEFDTWLELRELSCYATDDVPRADAEDGALDEPVLDPDELDPVNAPRPRILAFSMESPHTTAADPFKRRESRSVTVLVFMFIIEKESNRGVRVAIASGRKLGRVKDRLAEPSVRRSLSKLDGVAQHRVNSSGWFSSGNIDFRETNECSE